MVLLAVGLFLVSACHKKETAPQPGCSTDAQLRLAADEGPNTNARAAVAISRLLSLHFDGLDTSTLSTAGLAGYADLMKQEKLIWPLFSRTLPKQFFQERHSTKENLTRIFVNCVIWGPAHCIFWCLDFPPSLI